MKQAGRYLAVGVAAYLLILIINFPAGYVSDTLQQRLPGLALADVSGSVFSGRAGQANYEGLDLGEIRWRIRPLSLLLLRLEYRFSLSHPDNHGHLTLGIRPGSDVYGRALDLQLQPDRLINRFSPVTLQTQGNLALLLAEFTLGEAGIRDLSGTATWQDAAVESPLVLPLGEVGVELTSRNEDLVARVTRGGTLGVSGEILLQPGNRYTVDLRLNPDNSVSEETRGLLEVGMQPHPGGGYLLKTSGRLQ